MMTALWHQAHLIPKLEQLLARLSPRRDHPAGMYMYYTYDGLSKCLFPVLLINRNSMRAASCLPLKNMTYPDDVKTWKFFVTFGNRSKTTGIG